jgi:hypothetical protein
MPHKKIKKKVKKIVKKVKDLPSDEEIAEGISEIAQWWLTTPGVPVGMSPQSPLWDPLFGSQTTVPVQGVPLTQTPTVMPGTVVPEFLRQAIANLQFPGRPPRKPRVRTPKQRKNDEIQSVALTEVNRMARKKDGSWKKGWNQRRVMTQAQKKCTKERERLGLCKPKRKRKKTSSRNPYDSRLGLTRRRR